MINDYEALRYVNHELRLLSKFSRKISTSKIIYRGYCYYDIANPFDLRHGLPAEIVRRIRYKNTMN